MIKAQFFRGNDGLLTGYDIRGHAGTGEYGQDVLCAFVSSAAYMAANTITDVIGADITAQVTDGRMYITVSEKDVPECKAVLEGLLLHLKETEKQYPKNLNVIITEV